MPDPLQDPVMIEKKREKLSVIQIHYHFPDTASEEIEI